MSPSLCSSGPVDVVAVASSAVVVSVSLLFSIILSTFRVGLVFAGVVVVAVVIAEVEGPRLRFVGTLAEWKKTEAGHNNFGSKIYKLHCALTQSAVVEVVPAERFLVAVAADPEALADVPKACKHDDACVSFYAIFCLCFIT